MSLWRFRFLFYFAFLALPVFLFASSTQAQESEKDSNTKGPKMFGEFLLTTNYMDEAVSNSNNSFAVQPSLGLMWPHGQLGIRSSNVQFPDNGESLNIRPYAWFQFIFLPAVELKVRYDLDLYYASNQRNGNIYTFDLNLWSHHVIVENNSNWYGTSQGSYWLAYQHSWVLPAPNLNYKIEAGYLMVSASGYSSYMGAQTGLDYKYGDFFYQLLASYNSNAGEFANGTANPAIWVEISTRF